MLHFRFDTALPFLAGELAHEVGRELDQPCRCQAVNLVTSSRTKPTRWV